MRMIWGFIGLLIALAIVAMLVKKQIGATRIAVPPAVQGQGAPIDGAAPIDLAVARYASDSTFLSRIS